jgi:NosR/NirI family nitrous oxide reductase transcriptional regulator
VRRALKAAALVLALASWAAAFVAGGRRPGPDLEPFVRRAFPGARTEAIAPGVLAARRDGALVGYATTGHADGYSGPLTLAVASGSDGRLRAVALLEHHDTPLIVRSGGPLLRSLLGKGPGEAFRLGEDLDAVSGATHTSRGVALASLAAAQAIAERALAQTAQARSQSPLGAPEATLAVLLLAAAVGQNRQALAGRTRRLLRAATLGGSLAAIGIAFAQPWAIAFPIRLLAGDWPAWRTHLYWYALLGFTLASFARAGRSPYCPWVCPFGAAQDALGLATGAIRRRAPRRRLFLALKAGLLWLAVLLGLLYRNPAAASYEVFGAAFRGRGSAAQVALLAVVVLAALVVRRPFCHYACPVDALERALVPLRRRLVGRAALPDRAVARSGARAALAVPVFRRLRQGLVVAAGLLAVALAVAHLLTAVPAGAAADPGDLLADTYVSLDGLRP